MGLFSKFHHDHKSEQDASSSNNQTGQEFASNNPYRNSQPTASTSEKQDIKQPYVDVTDREGEQAPPPYDPWLAVPDNALLPPPPPIRNHLSPANNASTDEADRANAWCYQNPIWGPRQWDPESVYQMSLRKFTLCPPPEARSIKIATPRSGQTSLSSKSRQEDVTVLSNWPLYCAATGPLAPGEQKTIHYQVHIKHLSGNDATVAIGFLAPPYPPNRLPGWHRGSMAVHNDDGHRFVNDDCGGSDFVSPFGARSTVGIGMIFTGVVNAGPKVRCFFTRDGREESSWDLFESRDADVNDGGVMGLDGSTDLYAAIGICAGVELDVIWDSA